MEDLFLLMFWPVNEGLDLISCRFMLRRKGEHWEVGHMHIFFTCGPAGNNYLGLIFTSVGEGRV